MKLAHTTPRSARTSLPLTRMLPALTAWSIMVPGTHAQTVVEWKNPVSGNWNSGANWLPAQVPGNANTAKLGLAGPYAVTLPQGSDLHVYGLDLANDAAVLQIPTDTYFHLTNLAAGSGKVVVNSNFGGAQTRFYITDGVSLPFSVVLQPGAGGPVLDPTRGQLWRTNVGGTPPAIAASASVVGSGQIVGSFKIEGTLAPGNPVGRLIANSGTLFMTPTANTAIDIGSQFEHDVIDVESSIQLKGSLVINFLETYIPQVQDRLDVVLFTTPPLGSFDSVELTNVPPGASPRVIIDSKKVRVSMCYADCDGNDKLNIDDFICFQTEYALADSASDCDANGSLDIDDFICFQTLFALGC